MTPIQQLMLGVGKAKKKTYVDDVFSTYLYDGNSTTLSVNSGVDNTKGGMIWFKDRSGTESHLLFDTERGTSNYIQSNSTASQTTGGAALTSFDNDGYTLGASAYQNNSGRTYTSWNFRKAPGFFDIVTYTGNGSSNHQISHNLGSVPGCIMVKCTSETQDWMVYHVGTTDAAGPGGAYLRLNTTAAEYGSSGGFYNTTATSTFFTLGDSNIGNKNSASYVAYIFAGGESTAATARSVDFDGTGDRLTLGATSDFDFGTGDWTIEGWWKSDQASNSSNSQGLFGLGDYGSTGGMLLYQYNGYLALKKSNVEKINISSNPFDERLNQWIHVAVVKSGSTVTLYLNGESLVSYTDSGSYGDSPQNTISVGGSNSGHPWFGWISNFRVVKGTAVYTSSFKPTYEPLTNITNTKLLCCNNSSVTGKTVGGTITANGNPYASSDSPFDDPAGFVFGKAGDQNVIKCGSYEGASSHSTAMEVNVGFEPQWVMFKNAASASKNWVILDSMRKWSGADQPLVSWLEPNTTDAESEGSMAYLTSTGFTAKDSSYLNGSNHNIIYVAIRRPDGYVQKPQLATDVFAMDTGSGSSTIPNFDSGFPVDFTFARALASATNWDTGGRLMQHKYLHTNSTGAEGDASNMTFDSNVGWNSYSSWGSGAQSWMWKRHAGFDVVTYEGNGSAGHVIPHSMNKIPEMMWIRRKNATEHWEIYHKGLNGGTNPQNYGIKFFDDPEHSSGSARWDAPTATHITVNTDNGTNNSSGTYLMMLFASVNGISKVGYYDGSDNDLAISLGFSPRFVLIKAATRSDGWAIYDTTRGVGTGGSNDKFLRLNYTNAQFDVDHLDFTSTGFTLKGGGWNGVNDDGYKYIYYAHA